MCLKSYLSEEEGLRLINYPAWLYRFGRAILSDMDASEKAFCWLAFMSEADARTTIEQYVYAEYPYGSPRFQNMARKAWEAHLLIEKALKAQINPVVMCSWGKDSLVVLQMILMHNPNIPVLWNDTQFDLHQHII